MTNTHHLHDTGLIFETHLEHFDRDVIQASHEVPILVDFWADWCGPCKMIAPHVAALAQEFAGKAVVGKLNVDENPRVAGQFGIMSIPTLLLFKDGQKITQKVGGSPKPQLKAFIQQAM